MVSSISSRVCLRLYLVKLIKFGKKQISTAAVLKSMAASTNLLPMPTTFIGFASTVKTCFEEMIRLAWDLENP